MTPQIQQQIQLIRQNLANIDAAIPAAAGNAAASQVRQTIEALEDIAEQAAGLRQAVVNARANALTPQLQPKEQILVALYQAAGGIAGTRIPKVDIAALLHGTALHLFNNAMTLEAMEDTDRWIERHPDSVELLDFGVSVARSLLGIS